MKWIDCIPKGIKAEGIKAEQALSIVEEIFTVEKSLVGMQEKDIYKGRIDKTKPLLKECWKLLEGTMRPEDQHFTKQLIIH